MTPARWPIRTRLTVWYLAVLALATVILGAGGWWFMQESLLDAADSHLRARIDGARNLIRGMEHELSVEEIRDEFHEYAALTLGDGLIEVSDAAGVMLCQPPMAGWPAVASTIAVPAPERPQAFGSGVLDGRPVRLTAAATTVGARTYRIIAALPMGPAAEALRRFGWILVGLAPAVLLVAGLGGYWISRRALAPVDQLTRDVQAMTVRSLDRRLDVPAADDEIRRLATTFNEMLVRLEAGVADMTRFTAEAAHELRTPVTLVRTTADVALSRERPAEEYRQALSDVLTHAVQMSGLVGDLLVLARADAGVEPRETAPVDLGRVAATAARSVTAAAVLRQLTIDVQVSGGPVVVTGDEASLGRLVLILLDNAVKYTTPGGVVRVRVERPGAGDTPDRAVLDVIDAGPGIAPADRARVFDRFYRGATARQQVADGTGLGLSIAQAIVTRHGGSIEIAAGEGGTGCTVRVTLGGTNKQALGTRH